VDIVFSLCFSGRLVRYIPMAAWQRRGSRTMDLPSALHRLSHYNPKNARASRQIFEAGIVIYRNDAMHKLGDESTFP
jgi:hypothetical protein